MSEVRLDKMTEKELESEISSIREKLKTNEKCPHCRTELEMFSSSWKEWLVNCNNRHCVYAITHNHVFVINIGWDKYRLKELERELGGRTPVVHMDCGLYDEVQGPSKACLHFRGDHCPTRCPQYRGVIMEKALEDIMVELRLVRDEHPKVYDKFAKVARSSFLDAWDLANKALGE